MSTFYENLETTQARVIFESASERFLSDYADDLETGLQNLNWSVLNSLMFLEGAQTVAFEGEEYVFAIVDGKLSVNKA